LSSAPQITTTDVVPSPATTSCRGGVQNTQQKTGKQHHSPL
jgi:hypothetical protein